MANQRVCDVDVREEFELAGILLMDRLGREGKAVLEAVSGARTVCSVPSGDIDEGTVGHLGSVAVLERSGSQYIHCRRDVGEGPLSLFVQHWNEEACEEIEVGENIHIRTRRRELRREWRKCKAI